MSSTICKTTKAHGEGTTHKIVDLLYFLPANRAKGSKFVKTRSLELKRLEVLPHPVFFCRTLKRSVSPSLCCSLQLESHYPLHLSPESNDLARLAPRQHFPQRGYNRLSPRGPAKITNILDECKHGNEKISFDYVSKRTPKCSCDAQK